LRWVYCWFALRSPAVIGTAKQKGGELNLVQSLCIPNQLLLSFSERLAEIGLLAGGFLFNFKKPREILIRHPFAAAFKREVIRNDNLCQIQ
jgi:hypothetical protein